MTVENCIAQANLAIAGLIDQINRNEFGEMNEATLQHHLALNIHLEALKAENSNVRMVLEKKIRRREGAFPKKNSNTANIDVFFQQVDDGTRCAIELKCFHRVNQREPNNRYDAYADIANLEVYLEEHSDVSVFVLVTDHPHYFDNNFRAHSANTADFCLRNGHRYTGGTNLSYRTEVPYGPDFALVRDYEFNWLNLDHNWRVLVLTLA